MEAVRLLSSGEITKNLDICRQTFYNRIEELKSYGLFKHGRNWKMKVEDYNRYIDEQITKGL